jgi:predicted transcriptional regulator
MSEKLTLNLPENNYISEYIKFGRSQNDGYIEWHFAGAVSQLSIIADRKLVLRLKQGDVYPNIWFMGLGDSTISRKSTGMTLAASFITELGLDSKRLPNAFSPESFVETLSGTPKAFFWKDECSQLLASMQKTFMADLRDLFCDLYECGNYRRTLRTSQRANKKSDFQVTDSYLTQYLLTTPDNFREHVTLLDVTSGWLLRYMYLAPDYTKEWRGFTEKTESDKSNWIYLFKLLENKVNQLKDNEVVEMTISPQAWEFFNEWQKYAEIRMMEEKDKVAKATFGRLQVNALKLAILFEFGKPELSTVISIESLMEACRLVDDYFLPIAKDIIRQIEWDESKNLQEKILGTVRRTGGSMTRRNLLQALHKPLREVEESLNSLVESGEIQIEGKEGSNIIKLLQTAASVTSVVTVALIQGMNATQATHDTLDTVATIDTLPPQI